MVRDRSRLQPFWTSHKARSAPNERLSKNPSEEAYLHHPDDEYNAILKKPHDVTYCIELYEAGQPETQHSPDYLGFFIGSEPLIDQNATRGPKSSIVHEPIPWRDRLRRNETHPLFEVVQMITGLTRPTSWAYPPHTARADPTPMNDDESVASHGSSRSAQTSPRRVGECSDSSVIDRSIAESVSRSDSSKTFLKLDEVKIRELQPTELLIHSPLLIHFIHIFTGRDTHELWTTSFEEPYRDLIYHFEDIKALAFSTEEVLDLYQLGEAPLEELDYAEISYQFKALLSFLEPLYRSVYASLTRQLDAPQGPLMVSWRELWYIFRPRSVVYCRLENEGEETMVAGVVLGVPAREDPVTLRVDVWNLRPVGAEIGQVSHTYEIGEFSGKKNLGSLHVCPARYFDMLDGGEMRRTLIDRGKRIIDNLSSGEQEFSFEGTFIDEAVEAHRRSETGEGNYRSRPRRDDYYDDRPAANTSIRPRRVSPLPKALFDYELISCQMQGRVIIDMVSASLYCPTLTFELSFRENSKIVRQHANVKKRKAAEANHFQPFHPITVAILELPPEDNNGDEMEDDDDNEEEGTNEDRTDPSNDPVVQKRYSIFPNIKLKRLPSLKLHDDHFLLIHPLGAAFSWEDKSWGTINLGAASRVERLPDPLSTVVIEQEDLNVIEALSTINSDAEATWGADFITGKGRGQVVLLHGPPGVGKTYTVQCIAEAFRRPLLSLTIADLGADDQKIESKLTYFFALAEKWRAIILVDEADIFLERRKNADLSRNGIVTIFLRKMEYFSGLLFLTTNRVGQIDDAFVSRVNVFIGYGRLDDEKRGRLWDSFLDKLTRERKGKIKVMPGAKKYVKTSDDVKQCDWNGREVRNALQTAIALATFDKRKELAELKLETPDIKLDEMDELVCVEEHHFKKVVSMSRRFQKYLASVANADEKLRSRRLRDRNDYEGLQDDGIFGEDGTGGLSAMAAARLSMRRKKEAE